MRASEKVAFQYLQERGYQPKDIDFNTARVVDFVCSDGKKFEVKSLQHKRTLVFTSNQWNHFNKSKIDIIVVYNGQVRGVFPFEEVLVRGYKTSILGKATRITVPETLYNRALKAIKEGKFPGIRNFSAIVEFALVQLLEK